MRGTKKNLLPNWSALWTYTKCTLYGHFNLQSPADASLLTPLEVWTLQCYYCTLKMKAEGSFETMVPIETTRGNIPGNSPLQYHGRENPNSCFLSTLCSQHKFQRNPNIFWSQDNSFLPLGRTVVTLWKSLCVLESYASGSVNFW
jgi:hypothetical protein